VDIRGNDWKLVEIIENDLTFFENIGNYWKLFEII